MLIAKFKVNLFHKPVLYVYKHFKLILNVFSPVRRWSASLFTITRQICIKYPQEIKLHLLFFPKIFTRFWQKEIANIFLKHCSF